MLWHWHLRLSLAVTLAGTGAGLRRGLPDPQELLRAGQASAQQVAAATQTAASASGGGSTGLDAGLGSGTAGTEAQRAEQAARAGEGLGSRGIPDGIPRTGTGIHTLVTSNGSPYLNFQLRIMCGAVPRSGGPILLGFWPMLASRGSALGPAAMHWAGWAGGTCWGRVPLLARQV